MQEPFENQSKQSKIRIIKDRKKNGLTYGLRNRLAHKDG